MHIIRMILVTIVCGWLVALLCRNVISGLRTGRIHHTNSSSYYYRKNNSIAYWSLVILFLAMIIGASYSWFLAFYETFLMLVSLTP